MAYHNHTLVGLLYILERASNNRDAVSEYAKQTNESLTMQFLELPVTTTEEEAVATAFYELLVLVRAAEVTAYYAQAATLQDLGRMIRKLATRAGVTLTVQVE